MKHTFFSEREFENHTGLSFQIKSYAEMQIAADEKLIFSKAMESVKNVYAATYDVFDSSNNPLYSLAVRFDLNTDTYSFTKSHNPKS